jgi:hypothetical protein
MPFLGYTSSPIPASGLDGPTECSHEPKLLLSSLWRATPDSSTSLTAARIASAASVTPASVCAERSHVTTSTFEVVLVYERCRPTQLSTYSTQSSGRRRPRFTSRHCRRVRVVSCLGMISPLPLSTRTVRRGGVGPCPPPAQPTAFRHHGYSRLPEAHHTRSGSYGMMRFAGRAIAM